MGWVFKVFIYGFLATLLMISHRSLACEPGMEVPGEYLVRFQTSSSSLAQGKAVADPASLLASKGIPFEVLHSGKASKRAMSLSSKLTAPAVRPALYHLKNVQKGSKEISDLPGALSVEPNCYIRPFLTTNDSEYSEQWAHQVMESEKAWDISTGSKDIIVAVSDTGVDYLHPDLKDQMWVNQAEAQGASGVDDDNNGCVDDIYGCDFADEDGDPKPATSTGGEHGTHVAGIIGAVGNNGLGVAGINWNVRIMAVKGFSDSSELAKTDDLLKTVYYAADNGAHVINCSWGANQSPSSAERDAFSYALDMGMVVVVAAGNSAANAREFSPAGISKVITVASSNSRNELSSFSNYGTGIDVMAPGGDAPQFGGRDEKILSTVPGGRYVGLRGTSMAAPYVAGLAALVLSINPDLTNSDVEDIIVKSADEFSVTVPRSSNLKYTYGRINARKAAEAALASLPQPDPVPDCPPGQQCSQQGGGNPASRSADVSNAITSGFGGCSNEMRARSNTNKAEAPMAAFFLPLIILMILRRKK